MKWEYQVRHFSDWPSASPEKMAAVVAKWLNQQGQEGWELVSIQPAEGKHQIFYLKRPA
ncbi:protein of unknown function [Bradyrhizobium sp. Rc3b]|uniref:DUF4177 domain-containing protein n=1 Tax=Bradyrhizobium sp. Rc3b TaxID=1855322 RepID=UPI0008E74B7E|nr:DUF4177 domain-containing protein [Bradyrhizobium sp. Rc3b]SFM50636.1 protein of unknown function [Bradyrhizobium sp. Rc3b]